MHAQLIEGGTTRDRRPEIDRIVTDEMVPAFHSARLRRCPEPRQPRERRRDDDRALGTETQARRALAEYGGAFLKALASAAAISTGTRNPISIWEVNARA